MKCLLMGLKDLSTVCVDILQESFLLEIILFEFLSKMEQTIQAFFKLKMLTPLGFAICLSIASTNKILHY